MPVSELDRVARVEPWLADQGWLNREFAEIIRFNWPSQEAPVRISERPTMRLALDEPNRVPQPFGGCPDGPRAQAHHARASPPTCASAGREEEASRRVRRGKVVGS
jgi:hypothetical protein